MRWKFTGNSYVTETYDVRAIISINLVDLDCAVKLNRAMFDKITVNFCIALSFMYMQVIS